MPEKVIPDTSVIISGALLELIESGRLSGCELVIPLAVIDELQAQASKGKDTGLKGLEELKKLRQIAEEKGIVIRFSGERPGLEDIKLARSGRIDALIRDVAKMENGKLYTSDYVQALVAEAEGVPVEYIEPYERAEEFSFKKYLSSNTVSIYLRVGSPPLARIMSREGLELVRLEEKPCDEIELNRILEEVMASVRVREEVDVVMLKPEAMIIETKDFRISLSKPPFSDSLEAIIHRNPLHLIPEEAVVDPIVGKCLSDRRSLLILNVEKLYLYPIARRIAEKLHEHGLIVRIVGYARRTISPAYYYGPIEGDLEKSADYLLANLPDYVIFEEIRRSKDLRILKELKAAGSGIIAFMTSSSIKSAIVKLAESMKLGEMPDLFDELIILNHLGAEKAYSLTASTKSISDLGEKSAPVPVLRVKLGDTPILEAYELNGSIVFRDLKNQL